MDEAQVRAFAQSLQRLQQTESNEVSREDWKVLFPSNPEHSVDHTDRREVNHPQWIAKTIDELFEMFPHTETFADEKEGMLKKGWIEIGSRQSLGEGAFGQVFLAFRASGKRALGRRQLVAVKNTRMDEDFSPRVVSCELAALRACKHENICGYYSHFWVKDDDIYEANIIMEFLSAGDMTVEVTRYPDKRIPEPICRFYSKQISSALRYMHSKSILHRDLHLGNVVLRYMKTYTKSAVLCDFGKSLWIRNVPPAIATEIDHFLTRILIPMMTSQHFWMMGNPVEQKLRSHLSPEAIELMEYMTQISTWDQLLSLKWFTLETTAPVVTVVGIERSKSSSHESKKSVAGPAPGRRGSSGSSHRHERRRDENENVAPAAGHTRESPPLPKVTIIPAPASGWRDNVFRRIMRRMGGVIRWLADIPCCKRESDSIEDLSPEPPE